MMGHNGKEIKEEKSTEITPLDPEKLQHNKQHIKENTSIVTLTLVKERLTYAFCQEIKIGRSVHGEATLPLNYSFLSGHHCTLFFKEGKICLMDKSSKNGSFLGGERLRPGIAYELRVGDRFLLGQLEVQIGLMSLDEVKRLKLPLLDEVTFPSRTEHISSLKKFLAFFLKSPSQKTTKNKKPHYPKGGKISPPKAGVMKNAFFVPGPFPRAWSIIVDILISSSLNLFCSRQFSFYREMMISFQNSLSLIKESSFYTTLSPYLSEIPSNWVSFTIPYLISYMAFTLFFSLLLGVTLGQFFIGIRTFGFPLWTRLGGFLRALIGFVTFPFLVFDLSCFFHKRTLKEFLTFTALDFDRPPMVRFFRPIVTTLFVFIGTLFIYKMDCLKENDLSCEWDKEANLALQRPLSQWGEFLPHAVLTYLTSDPFGKLEETVQQAIQMNPKDLQQQAKTRQKQLDNIEQ